MSSQLGTGVVEAGLGLRATAYVQSRRVSAVAEDVMAGRLRYVPEHG